MSGIGPVSGINSSMPPMQPAPTSGAEGTSGVQSGLASGSVVSGQALTSISSSSVSMASESVMYSRGPVLADEQLLGLVLLMLTLEYMQSDDEDEKKGLLALMLALSQQQAGTQELFMYSGSSLMSMESSQLQGVSSETVANAYSGSAGAAQPASGADPGVGQLDVSA